MPRKNVFNVSIAAFIALTLACGIIGNPQESTGQPTEANTAVVPYVTSTPQRTSNMFQNAPTPIVTVEARLQVQTFADTKLSDVTGSVIIEDSLASMRLNIRLQDTLSKKPVPQVQIQFISDGKMFAIAALDPTGRYLPMIRSGLLSSLVQENPNSNYRTRTFGISSAKAAAFAQTGWHDVKLVLDLVNALENVSTVKDLAGLLQDLPSLEKWTTWYSESCWTGEQIANTVGLASGVAGIVLPISGAALTSTVGDPELGLMLASMVAISIHIATEDAQSYLANLPGTHRLRIYHFPLSFSFFAVEYLGRCDTPLPTPTPRPTHEPQTLLLRHNCGTDYNVILDKPIRLYYGGWASNGLTFASAAYNAITINLTIDGQLVEGEKQPIAADLPAMCGKDWADSYWVYYAANIPALTEGAHRVVVEFLANDVLSDGYEDTVGPGLFSMHVFTITATAH